MKLISINPDGLEICSEAILDMDSFFYSSIDQTEVSITVKKRSCVHEGEGEIMVVVWLCMCFCTAEILITSGLILDVPTSCQAVDKTINICLLLFCGGLVCLCMPAYQFVWHVLVCVCVSASDFHSDSEAKSASIYSIHL